MNEMRFLAAFLADVFDAIEVSAKLFDLDERPKCETKSERCCKKHRNDLDDFDAFSKCFGDCGIKNTPGNKSPFNKDAENKHVRPWGVAEVEPKEDPNKVFGINIRVDEPKRSWYDNRRDFERDHAKFDNLVDAAEACDWENKDNDAPLHKVNCIRKRVDEEPPMYINLIGESHYWG